MKKFVAMLLAVMMILSCAALAADDNMVWGTDTTKKFYEATDNKSATQRTDVWLQVEASGKIDVTVPLVVVFKTNIDGGVASTANTSNNPYKIVNNSTAGVKVTEVKVVDQKTDVTTNGVTANLTMVDKFTDGDRTKDKDKYTLTMLPTDKYATPEWNAAINVADKNETKPFTQTTETATYTRTSNTAETKGLFYIGNVSDGDGKNNESPIDLTLTTSPLSFVTKKDTTSDAGTETYGVKMFTISYTVAIDDSEAKNTTINGEGEGAASEKPSYDWTRSLTLTSGN